jgi:hypothetical protein
MKKIGVKVITKTLCVAAMLVASTAAMAQDLDDISLGQPGHAGSGCPSGSISTTLSPDKKALSILFDEFILEAGPSNRKRMDRKNCNIAIPVHVPNGFSVSVMAVDYRGYNYLPQGAQTQFRTEYFFAGQRGPRYMKTFSGQADDDFTLSNILHVVGNVWSECGEDVNLRIATSMRLMNRNRNEDAMSTIDSVDISSGIVYKLQYKTCFQTPVEDDSSWGDDDWF